MSRICHAGEMFSILTQSFSSRASKCSTFLRNPHVQDAELRNTSKLSHEMLVSYHHCVQALEALQELDPGTWLKGFVVAKRPFGYLISVAPPETEGRGAGARAIGLAYRKEVEGALDVGSEVTWAPHLGSI